jgi:hypothetical protein
MALAARAMLAKPSKNKVYDVGYAVEDELGVHGQGSFCQPADQPLMQMDRCQSRDVFGLVANEPAELLKTQHKFYLDPKTKFRRKWDVIMLWLLVFTAIATPFEVAVLDPEKGTQFFWSPPPPAPTFPLGHDAALLRCSWSPSHAMRKI